MYDIKEETRRILEGCVIAAEDGTRLYTPDGKKNYNALWTRDFAYMTEYAGELLPPEDIRADLFYLLSRADADGWMPDRAEADGRARYTAGGEGFPARRNLDNGPFAVILAGQYLDIAEKTDPAQAKADFTAMEEPLCRGLACLPVSENGLVVNEGEVLHSPYGFTDCIAKSGCLAMESLLLYRAYTVLADLNGRFGRSPAHWRARAAQIEAVFADTFSAPDGMLYAASDIGHQKDLWASAYAVSIGFPLSDAQKHSIALWFHENRDLFCFRGQIRHLPRGEYWEKTLIPVEKDTYQNGAYWAVPSVWVCDALKKEFPEEAKALVSELLADFEENGIFECISPSGRKLETYAASAACAYGAFKRCEWH